MIRIENLRKVRGDHAVLKDLCLEIPDGEILGIVGPSGSGKSMLLRLIMGLEKPELGNIFIDGDPRIGMVFQNCNLYDKMSVIENVVSGPIHIQNKDPKTALLEGLELLKSVGLADSAFAYPEKLSKGKKQRAAIARTLAMDPDIILLDEPTGYLDPLMRGEVESVIRMLAGEGRTLILASNEMDLVRNLCTRVIFLSNGEICEEGSPQEIFDDPKKTETRRFVSALRVLEFNIRSKDFDFIGSQTIISEFSYKNGVGNELKERLLAITEELFQMVIIRPEANNIMHISFEYDRSEKYLRGSILFSGQELDITDPDNMIPWSIIKGRASEVSLEHISEDKYTNRINIIIR